MTQRKGTQRRGKPGKDSGLARVFDQLGVGETRERLNDAPKAATPSLERQQWLEQAVEALRTRFAEAGYTIPEKIRFSIGWPKRSASCGAIGECWATKASSDQHAELFISPELSDSVVIMAVIAHELDHATVNSIDPKAGHGKLFKQCALKIGLQGPMRATTASPGFAAWAETVFKHIGPYPAGYLIDTPKQGTRTRKCECPMCGYIARVTRKWLSDSGPPICPRDHVAMMNDDGIPAKQVAE